MDQKMILKKIKEIEKYAKDNKLHQINKELVNYLSKFIIDNNIKTILEVGTGVGYSSIIMALCDEKIKVTTIERDHERYLQALKNIKDLELEDQITLVFNDALELKLDDEYDLIFLDGAKGRNMEYFTNFSKNLKKKGYIITENISFHGMLDKKLDNENLQSIVDKIKEYISFLDNHELFHTTYYNVGDRIAVTNYK